MPIDPSVLLGAKGIDIPSPFQQMGQNLTLGNLANQFQMGQMGVQEAQGMMSLLQEHPEYLQAFMPGGGQGGQGGQGGPNISNLTPGQGMALMKAAPSLLNMAKTQAETKKALDDAAKAHQDMVTAAIEPLANRAKYYLSNSDDANWNGLLEHALQVKQRLGPDAPPMQIDDVNNPQQRTQLAQSLWTYSTKPAEQEKMGETIAQAALTRMNTAKALADIQGIPFSQALALYDSTTKRAEATKIITPPGSPNPIAINPNVAEPNIKIPPPVQTPGMPSQPTPQFAPPNAVVQPLTAAQRMIALRDSGGGGIDAATGQSLAQSGVPSGTPTATPITTSATGGAAPLIPPPDLMKAREEKVAEVSKNDTTADRVLQIVPPLLEMARSGYNGPIAGSETGRKVLQFLSPFLPQDMQEKIASTRASDVLTGELLGSLIKEMSQRGGQAVMRQALLFKPGTENSLQSRLQMGNAMIQDAYNMKNAGRSLKGYIQTNPSDYALSGWQSPPPAIWVQHDGMYHQFPNETQVSRQQFKWAQEDQAQAP